MLSRPVPLSLLLLLALPLAGCGGGGGGEEPPPPPPPPQLSVAGTITGLAEGDSLILSAGDVSQTLSANGPFTLAEVGADGAQFQLRVSQQPATSYCVVYRGHGRFAGGDASAVKVDCRDDEAAPLLDPEQLQRLRLTVSVDDWQAFVLNTDRSAYSRDANGHGGWNLWSVSELYRKASLALLDANGAVVASIDHVGFRMRGNTSRQWPEHWYETTQNNWQAVPSRFHFNLKFDEDFSGDESVYACVDGNGQPAAINSDACGNRLADDIPDVPENDDRTFMGLESFALKFNKDDPTYIHEALAHNLMNDVGVVAGRATHARLELVIEPSATITSLYNQPLPQSYNMGIYTLTEPVDKILVKRVFGKNGYLFKVGGGDLTSHDSDNCLAYEDRGSVFVSTSFCQIGVEQIDPDNRSDWLGASHANDPSYINRDINGSGPTSQFAPYRPPYDLKTKKDEIGEARQHLTAFIDLLSTQPSAAELAEVFDVDGFIKAQAADIVIGAVDHYVRVANNYYLYRHPTSGKWHYIPYDYDFSFRNNHPSYWGSVSAFQNVASSTLFDGSNSWRAGRLNGLTPVLWDILMADPGYRQQLEDEVAAIGQRWLNWSERTGPLVERWLDRLEPTIRTTQGWNDPGLDTSYSRSAATGSSGDTIRTFIETRRQALGLNAPAN